MSEDFNRNTISPSWPGAPTLEQMPLAMPVRRLLLAVPVLITLAAVGLCRQIVVDSGINQQNKQDWAEIHHIKYGLFSINEWKRQLAVIIADEITKLNLSTANERELKKHVQTQRADFCSEIN